MRIGIMTLWNTQHNYGAVLQCFALQEYLRRNGHHPFLIRYKAKATGLNLTHISMKKIIKFVSRKVDEKRKSKIIDQPRYFSDFINEYISQTEKDYIGYEELKDTPPEADMYLVGSDQVWNFYNTPIELCREHIHAFFLDFGNSDIKKISYAASWDKDCVTEEQLKEIKPLIDKFTYVSVREKSGLELCQKCGINNAEWVPDPTLLLSAEDYRRIYLDSKNHIRKIEEPYIMIYNVLTQKQKFDISYIYDFAEENNLRVIYVCEDKTQDEYEKYYPTIPEWLYLMDNAKYVVTNSFHGTVFSLIFHKQFVNIPLTGSAAATNNRVKSLFEMFKTEGRYVVDHDLAILDKQYTTDFQIDYNNFFRIVEMKK